MNAFDIAAVLLTVAAVCGYLNHYFLPLPATSGTLAVALISSLVLVGTDAVLPFWTLQDRARAFLADIDFNETLMRGFLRFLLFAGALHVDREGLFARTARHPGVGHGYLRPCLSRARRRSEWRTD